MGTVRDMASEPGQSPQEQEEQIAQWMDVLPGLKAGVSIFATPSPIEGSRMAEEDVGRSGIEPSAAKAYPSPA
jgi:hypothetical protein